MRRKTLTMLQTLLTDFPWLATTFHKAPIWVWIALPLLFLTAFVFGWLIMRIVISGLARSPQARKRLDPLVIPLALLLAAILFDAGSSLLPLGKRLARDLGPITIGLHTFAVTCILFRLADLAALRMQDVLLLRGRRSIGAIIPLLRKIGKAAIAILGLLFLLQNFGLNVAAIIAGLGIGGVALALASQKSIENLLGGIMLALDQPVRVGDFCRYGDGKTGTVEDIGLRSTRIRTMEHTLVTIPNADFSSLQLENFAPRERILLQTTIGLRYETTAEQLEHILERLRTLLGGHTAVAQDTVRVRFTSFSATALNVELFAYFATSEYPEFMAIREALFLQVLQIVRDAGTDFAFPLQAPPPVPRHLEKTA
jgi:MscS family membrane protein